MSVVRSEKFIMVESDNNHNKCWYIEEHDNGMIRTTWGRVGNSLSTTEKQFGSSASKEYDKLVKSKLKKVIQNFVQLILLPLLILKIFKRKLLKILL